MASSPAFRHRFCVHHPPPLLGIFFSGTAYRYRHLFPPPRAVVPARPSDGDLAAAVRGGDFFLTSLQVRGPFFISKCRGGLVLLSDGPSFAVLNPLSRQIKFHHTLDSSSPITRCSSYQCWDIYPRLLCSDEDPESFRLLLLANRSHSHKARVLAVFSSDSDTGGWSLLPSMEVCLPYIDGGINNMQDWGPLLDLPGPEESGFT